MIKATKNIDEIIRVWLEAFDDSKEEVVFFCKNVKDAECLAYFENGIAVSMLYLIKCELSGRESSYIYAASTAKEYRKRGYMSRLLEYCIEQYGDVCLIPSDEKLVEYYKKRGFIYLYDINALHFNQIKELTDEYLFDGCSLNNPILLGSKGE